MARLCGQKCRVSGIWANMRAGVRGEDGAGDAERSCPSRVVDVRGLHVRFGEVEAVAGVDLAAYAGQATALLGRNGAGKSTTMRVLAGVVPPTAGTGLVAGHDVRTADRSRRQAGQSATAPTWAAWCRGRPPWEHLQLVGPAAPDDRLGGRARATCWSGSSSATSPTG